MINEEKLYIISAYGVITCMNKNNGEILWKVDIIKQYDGKNIQWGITENLLIHNEKLFCTSVVVKVTPRLAYDENSFPKAQSSLSVNGRSTSPKSAKQYSSACQVPGARWWAR